MPIPPRYPLLSEMRVEQVTANQVRKTLAATVNQIDADIRKMDKSTNPITRMQAEAQRAALRGYMAHDWEDIEADIAAGRKTAAREASKVVSKYENQLLKMVLDRSAMEALAKSEANRAVSGVDAAVRRMQGRSYVPLSKQVYDTKKLADGWIDETINRGLAAGWSQRRLASTLRSSIDPNVPGGVSYAANRVARTEVNNAFHASAADRYMNSSIVEAVDWHLSSSHPEGDICDSLAADGPYPKKSVPKKPHPHCYCFITPVLPTDEEFIEKLFNGDYGDEPWVAKADTSKLPTPAVKALRPLSTTDKAAYRKAIDDDFMADVRDQMLQRADDNIALLARTHGVSEAEVRKRISSNVQQFLDESTPSVMVKSENLEDILNQGFKSTYQTGTGIGRGDAGYMSIRKDAEAGHFGQGVHPIYGFMDNPKLAKKDIFGNPSAGDLDVYGDVKVVLKDGVRERATVSLGDSLNNTQSLTVSSATKVSEYSVPRNGAGMAYEGKVADSINQYVELQFPELGAIDIERVVFKKSIWGADPDPALIKALEERGIKWSVE